MIFVSGFDFCGSGPKEFHINSLTRKILCEAHNTRLGKQVDHVGGELFEAIRKFTTRRKQEEDFPSIKWLPAHYNIDASLLERWFLKIMLGISFGQSLIIGPEQIEVGQVPPELVRIAFGLEPFTHGRGLYIAYKDKETFQLEDRFRYTAKTIGAHLLMGYFHIHGLRFYLNLNPAEGEPLRVIEESEVFYRKAHFIDSAIDLKSVQRVAIPFMASKSNSTNQKLSIS